MYTTKVMSEYTLKKDSSNEDESNQSCRNRAFLTLFVFIMDSYE